MVRAVAAADEQQLTVEIELTGAQVLVMKDSSSTYVQNNIQQMLVEEVAVRTETTWVRECVSE